MIRRMFALAGAVLLVIFALAGCGSAAVETIPTITLPEDLAAEAAPSADSSYDDTLEGLCAYLEANNAVVRGDTEAAFTEMSYREIGATGGVRYRFRCGNGTVQAEFYEFDLDALDAKGKECIDSVRETGKFTVLGNEVEAELNGSGKYLMIYHDTRSDEENAYLRQWVEDCFLAFKSA